VVIATISTVSGRCGFSCLPYGGGGQTSRRISFRTARPGRAGMTNLAVALPDSSGLTAVASVAALNLCQEHWRKADVRPSRERL
jgi:hypothetical protein